MDLGLADRRFLVGGASRGLGAAVARALVAEGARVAGISRDPGGAGASSAAGVVNVAADLSDADGPAAAVQAAVDALGGLDGLLVNTGGPPGGSFATVDDAAWERAIAGTLQSTIRLIREAVPHLRDGRDPSIVIVLSSSVREPIPALITSNVLRPGLAGLIKSLVTEIAPIRINGVAPGRFDTDRVRSLDAARAADSGSSVEEVQAQTRSRIPLGRYGDPDELGRVVAFLLSPAASYLDGVILPVDGGMLQPAVSQPLTLSGVYSVLPTAFRSDGALDLDGTAALVRATADAGVSGLTVLGVMGEAAELSEDERHQVVACVEATTTLPIVVGVSGGSARVVSTRARAAARSGVGGIMVSPSRSLGLADAVAAAAAGGLPIIIQDFPAGSGISVSAPELIAVVADQPLVVGVKAEAVPTSGLIETLRAAHPRLGLVGGLGGLFLIDELRAGATGVMTGFAMPERLVSVVRTYPADPEAATDAWVQLLPLMRLEAFQPFSLAARKEVWRLRGVIASSYCRRPGAGLDDRARDDVQRALSAVVALIAVA